MAKRFLSLPSKLWRRSRIEQEMDAEMRSHIEACVANLMSQGLARDDAERKARVEFGSIDAAKEEARRSLGFGWIDGILRDIRYSLRVHRAAPTWTASAILTLALCIGANTAIFSVVDAVLLRPLPYPKPDRLVQFVETVQSNEGQETNLGHDGRTWFALKKGVTAADAAVFTETSSLANFSSGPRIGTLRQQRVSSGFFSVLGFPFQMGREFTAEEDSPGGPSVVILSYDAWQREFGGSPSIIGTAINLRGEPHTVIGVTSREFRNKIPADVWTPVRPSTTGEGGGQNYAIIGRLRPEASFAQAESQAEAVGRDLIADRRSSPVVSIRYGIVNLQRGLSENLHRTLAILWASVAIVLVIGCLNIASLLVARHLGRTREIATRIALGGGRTAVIRQLLIESMLIGAAGAVVGTALGYAGISAFNQVVPETLGIWQDITLDVRVLTLTISISVAASILFGLFPAFHATRLDIRSGLSNGGGRSVAGERRNALGRILVVCEIALGVMLVIGAALLIRTFNHFMDLKPGFDGSHLVVAKFSLQDARYASAASIRSLMERGMASIHELPGVESAAAGLCLPYERPLNNGVFVQGEWRFSNICYATPGYFATLKIPILAGRDFTSADRVDSESVAIVNETFVRKYFGGKDPIGMQVTFGRPNTIIGVVGAIPLKAGFNNYEPVDRTPAVFISVNQPPDSFFTMTHTWFTPSWIVRTSSSQEAFVPSLMKSIQDIDRTLPIAGIYTIQDLQKKTLAPQEFNAELMGMMAGLAFLLALVGVYGLISNSVAKRKREMGIRLALGASTLQAVGQVASEGIVLALLGAALGLVLARLTSEFLRGLVFGLSTTDVVTFLAVAVGLVLVASLASIIPSLRVAAIDPATTLKAD